MSYKYALFDVDGTLLDSSQGMCLSFVKLMTELLGRPVSREEYADYWGVPGGDTLRMFGVTDPEEEKRWLAKWDRYIREFQELCPPYPGIEEMVVALAGRDVELALVTSRNLTELDDDMKSLAIRKYFSCAVTADDTKLHKPNPDPLLEAIRRLKAEKNECLYVGDTAFDARCALAAGVDFALATWGFVFGEPQSAPHTHRLASPADVLPMFA